MTGNFLSILRRKVVLFDGNYFRRSRCNKLGRREVEYRVLS